MTVLAVTEMAPAPVAEAYIPASKLPEASSFTTATLSMTGPILFSCCCDLPTVFPAVPALETMPVADTVMAPLATALMPLPPAVTPAAVIVTVPFAPSSAPKAAA